MSCLAKQPPSDEVGVAGHDAVDHQDHENGGGEEVVGRMKRARQAGWRGSRRSGG